MNLFLQTKLLHFGLHTGLMFIYLYATLENTLKAVFPSVCSLYYAGRCCLEINYGWFGLVPPLLSTGLVIIFQGAQLLYFQQCGFMPVV